MNGLADYQQLFGTQYAATPARRPVATGLAQRHRGGATSRDRLIVPATNEHITDLVSDVRAKKVAALRQAIAEGTYCVSAADLANKLIGSLRRIS